MFLESIGGGVNGCDYFTDWVDGEYRPVWVQLIGGDADLLVGMGVIGGAAHNGRFRKAQLPRWVARMKCGDSQWGKSAGISFCANYARLYKTGWAIREMENCALEVLAVQADCGAISEVMKVSASERGGGLEWILLRNPWHV